MISTTRAQGPLSVLLTNLHLDAFEGSETYTFTLAKGLRDLGHRVVVYSPILGRMAERIARLGVQVCDDLEAVRGQPPDVMHIQHNVLAVQARALLPRVPLVFHCHGVLPPPEQPPSIDLNIQHYLAVSEEVRDHLRRAGVPPERIAILRNPVDTRRFRPGRPLRQRPRAALILSNRIDADTLSIIQKACRQHGIAVRLLGQKTTPVWDVERHLNRADIVFSLGRGVLEAMACGRAVYIYDYQGADGWITPESVAEIQRCNFSGRRYGRRLSEEALVEDLRRYDPAMGPANRAIAEAQFSLEAYLPRLLDLYDQAIAAFQEKPLALPGFETGIMAGTIRDSFRRQQEFEEWARRLERELQAAWQERDALRGERDAFWVERDAARAERDAIRRERDQIRAQRDAFWAERDAFWAQREALEALQNTFGYRLLERARRAVRWLFPAGSRRGLPYRLLLRLAKRLLDRGQTS